MRCKAKNLYSPLRGRPMERPVLMWRVPAGFPSPAEDYIEGRIDLNRDLIRHPLATFYVRVSGDSMEPLIQSGAILIVDRMLETKDDDIVIARIEDELCVKRLKIAADGSVLLFSDNPNYPPIIVNEATNFEIWGKVQYAIHSV